LAQAEESFNRQLALKARGMDLKFIAKRVAALLGLSEDDV
jgi:hypothetical protein